MNNGTITAISVAPCQTKVVAGYADGGLTVFDLASTSERTVVGAGKGQTVVAVSFSDSRTVLSVNGSGRLLEYKLPSRPWQSLAERVVFEGGDLKISGICAPALPPAGGLRHAGSSAGRAPFASGTSASIYIGHITRPCGTATSSAHSMSIVSAPLWRSWRNATRRLLMPNWSRSHSHMLLPSPICSSCGPSQASRSGNGGNQAGIHGPPGCNCPARAAVGLARETDRVAL